MGLAKLPRPSNHVERFIHTLHIRLNQIVLLLKTTSSQSEARGLNAFIKQRLSGIMNQNTDKHRQQMLHNTDLLGFFLAFQKLEHTQFRIFDMSVSNNKAKTHAWWTPFLPSRKHVQQSYQWKSKPVNQ